MKRALRLLSLIAVAFYATACRESDDPSDALSPEGVPLLAKMNGNDFYQCQTENPRNSYCTWISGTLNRTHNQYFEDDVIPQKMRLDEAVGRTRVTLEYGFRKGGSVAGDQFTGDYHGNYDFMASYDGGTGPSNPCNDKLWSYFCTGTDQNGTLKGASAFPFGVTSATLPAGDMSGLTATEQNAYTAALARYDAAKRKLMVLNAKDLVITNLSFTRSGDATIARMIFEFTAPDKASQVAILFGMHFAYEADWGAGRGAAGQSGSPFHTKLVEVRTGIGIKGAEKVLNTGAMALNVAGDVVQTFPSLSLTKSAGASVVNAGDVVSYTITITNGGTGAASNVTISDDLPTNAGLSWAIDPANANCSIVAGKLSCSFPTLGAGATASVTLTSPTTAATCGTISNTATASADGTSVAGSPTAPVTIQVNCPALGITKTALNGTVNPGEDAGFTITVRNSGLGDAIGVVMTDTLPNSGLTWSIQSTTGSPTCTFETTSEGKPVLQCTLSKLNANASFSVTVKANIPSSYVMDPPAPPGTPLAISGDPAHWVPLGINCQQGAEVGCKLDKETGKYDDSFGQGTSEDSPVPTVVAGSIPNNKSDLLRFYVASERFETTDYLYLAWRRVQAPNGTTNMDFELNQSSEKSSNGVTRVRTAGDLLIKFDLAKGGTTPTLGYHRWVTAASAAGRTPSQACEAANAFPCWGKGETLTHDVAAAINTAPVSDPIAPATARPLDALTFGEARINLQATGIFQQGVCVNFGSAYLKSRSSDSFNSEIKDFIAPVDVSVTNCRAKDLNNRAWATAAYVTAISAEAKVEVKPTGT